MCKKILIICITILAEVLLCISCHAFENEIRHLSFELSNDIDNTNLKKIAVVDFLDLKGNATQLGRFIAEELSVSLTNSSNGFDIVDRFYLKKLIDESKLSLSGYIDPDTAHEIGRISGIQALITGTITEFDDKVRLTSKVIDTTTGKVVCAKKTFIPKSQSISNMFAKKLKSYSSHFDDETFNEAIVGIWRYKKSSKNKFLNLFFNKDHTFRSEGQTVKNGELKTYIAEGIWSIKKDIISYKFTYNGYPTDKFNPGKITTEKIVSIKQNELVLVKGNKPINIFYRITE